MTDDAVPSGPSAPGGPRGDLLARENLRASHEDRDQIVEQLRVAGGDGRLEPEELEQRVEAALTARTYGQLAALVADLPTTAAGPPGRPARKVRETARIDSQHGTIRKDGHWAVPQRLEISVKHGNVVLDFTQAEITWPTLQADVDLRHSNLVVITRPGVTVDTDNLVLNGGNARVRAPRGPEAPAVLHVSLAGKVHHSNVVARTARWTFWDWLRRPRPYAALPPGRP